MKIPAKSRTLPAIAEGLSKVGYKTDFLYGGDINFTNMKSYLLSTGYQRLTANTAVSYTHLQLHESGSWRLIQADRWRKKTVSQLQFLAVLLIHY